MKILSCIKHFQNELLIGFVLLELVSPISFAQASPDTVFNEYNSGEPGLVEQICPAMQILEVQDIHTWRVSVNAGGNPVTYPEALLYVDRMTDTIYPDQKDWFLHSDQDNESLIKSIGRYINTFYDVTPKYIFDEEDKLILTYDLKSGDSPTIKVYVEVLGPNERTFGKVVRLTERRIKVSSYIDVSEYIKDKTVRIEILEFNNTWLNKLWVPHSITLSTSGNIALHSSISIPGKDFPLPIECIRELLSGTLAGWEEYSAELQKLINQQKY